MNKMTPAQTQLAAEFTGDISGLFKAVQKAEARAEKAEQERDAIIGYLAGFATDSPAGCPEGHPCSMGPIGENECKKCWLEWAEKSR